MDRPLLIATKLNEASDEVVRSGALLARALGAPVRIVHAFKMPVLADSQAAASESAYDSLERGLRESMAEQAARHGIGDDMLDGLDLESGPIAQLLAGLARQFDTPMVVVGGENEWGLGRRAERILRHTSRPVFVVRQRLALPLGRVLAPVDLSALSADAFRCGLDLLDRLGDGARPDVEALFVLNPLERVGSMHFTPQQIDRFAASEMARFLEQNATGWTSMRSRIEQGQAKSVILQEAGDSAADLLMMGTHGRTGFERVVLGSVTEEIVRRSPCNLLVIPPSAALRAAISGEQRSERAKRATDEGAERELAGVGKE